jgi:hypothetical protein
VLGLSGQSISESESRRIQCDEIWSFVGMKQAFGADIDYAMLVKLYRGGNVDGTRYSPAECIGYHKEPISIVNDPLLKSQIV